MKKQVIIFMMAVLVMLTGCQGNTPQTDSTKAASNDSSQAQVEDKKEENMQLSIGLMPAVDTAPILLADEKGYFNDLGLDVSIDIYTNAQDRQTALQTNSIDGAMTDLVAVATNVNGGFDIKATTITDGMFPILASPDSIEKSSISVGMMEVSVSNFLVDEWLGSDYEIEKVFINPIPGRLEAVASGQVDMGLFPEPVATIGESKGLTKLVFEPQDGNFPDVMVFTGQAISDKPEAIKAFHEAYNKAVIDIQNDQMLARDVLVKRIPNIKEGVKDLMLLPEYEQARTPELDYIQKIIDWANTELKLDLTVEAEDLIDGSFIK